MVSDSISVDVNAVNLWNCVEDSRLSAGGRWDGGLTESRIL
jgi:hypothetical protein